MGFVVLVTTYYTAMNANYLGKSDPIGKEAGFDLAWRGVRYDTYLMQKLTNWRPVLSPAPGDPLFDSAPH